jgi:hypothetical protein
LERVRTAFLDRYEVQQAGGRTIPEYWIPAEDLDEFNANIVGTIEVIAEYRSVRHVRTRRGISRVRGVSCWPRFSIGLEPTKCGPPDATDRTRIAFT